MIMIQTLYILTGSPYSGKTTLTKKLVERFDFNVASMDIFIDKLKMNPDTMTQEDWNEVYSKGYEVLEKFLDKGRSVILDLGNLKKRNRDTARRIAKDKGVRHVLIYVNTPSDEIQKRWHENEKTQQRGQLSKIGFQRAIDMFEPPTLDEDHIVYNQEIDLDDWIKDNSIR